MNQSIRHRHALRVALERQRAAARRREFREGLAIVAGAVLITLADLAGLYYA